jgi:two-component system, LytTR family, response regulator
MIKVIIVDDESLARKLVKQFLSAFKEFEVIDECADGFAAAKSISKNEPDLVFLDVQMPRINGFELLELLDPIPNIIFTTAFDQYAIKAFEASAIDYLLKPFDKERFAVAISKFKMQFHGLKSALPTNQLLSEIAKDTPEMERIAVKSGNEIRIIPINQIRYLEAYDDYVKIFTKEDMFLKKQTLSYFESNLPNDQFIRIHRSFILNIKELTKIEQAEKDSHWVILRDQSRISVSRSGYQKLKQNLGI